MFDQIESSLTRIKLQMVRIIKTTYCYTLCMCVHGYIPRIVSSPAVLRAEGYCVVHTSTGLIISQTSCPDIFQEGGLVYMVSYTNFTSQVVKLVGQMPKLTKNVL